MKCLLFGWFPFTAGEKTGFTPLYGKEKVFSLLSRFSDEGEREKINEKLFCEVFGEVSSLNGAGLLQ